MSEGARELRLQAYLTYFRLGGRHLGQVWGRMRREDTARSAHLGLPDRLRATLEHAAANVPYYREHLDGAGAEIAADPFAALARLPILDKATVRARGEDLCCSDLDRKRVYEQTSGGSTGEPVHVIQDACFRDHDNAVQWLISSWTGWKPGESEVVVFGSHKDIFDHAEGFRTVVADRLMKRQRFNAFRMQPEAIEEYLAALDRERPRILRGYSQSLFELAEAAGRNGTRVAPQQAIISTASMLYPQMRERIEAAFGCRVLDQYGTREVSAIGAECGRGPGMHTLPWMNYIEVVDDDGEPVEPGTEGRVVATSLCNRAMPLLRYDVGDRARLMEAEAPPCPCGREGQRLDAVLGRSVDMFRAADGTRVDGTFFVGLLGTKDAIDRYQVVQRRLDLVEIRTSRASSLGSEEEAEIASRVRGVLGDGCEVVFETVEEISPSPSGKYRYTISEL